MKKLDRFFRDAGSWFIEHDAILQAIPSNDLRIKINRQARRALLFGVLIGFLIGLSIK